MTNRVAELESAVAQLQATVDGLRAELVDANERIRALENETAEDPETADNNVVPLGLLDESPAEPDEKPAPSDDIIVA